MIDKRKPFLAFADGSVTIRLTEDQYEDHNPTWSPNSQFIAFTSVEDDNFEVNIIRHDGRDRINLSQSSAADMLPLGHLTAVVSPSIPHAMADDLHLKLGGTV